VGRLVRNTRCQRRDRVAGPRCLRLRCYGGLKDNWGPAPGADLSCQLQFGLIKECVNLLLVIARLQEGN